MNGTSMTSDWMITVLGKAYFYQEWNVPTNKSLDQIWSEQGCPCQAKSSQLKWFIIAGFDMQKNSSFGQKERVKWNQGQENPICNKSIFIQFLSENFSLYFRSRFFCTQSRLNTRFVCASFSKCQSIQGAIWAQGHRVEIHHSTLCVCWYKITYVNYNVF